jgi:hypothetical protein
VRPVVISGRDSLAVAARMHDLKLEHYLGIHDKVACAEQVLAREGATGRSVRWWATTCPTSRSEARGLAHRRGRCRPRGAARRAHGDGGACRLRRGARGVEKLLQHNGTWPKVLERYEAQ